MARRGAATDPGPVSLRVLPQESSNSCIETSARLLTQAPECKPGQRSNGEMGEDWDKGTGIGEERRQLVEGGKQETRYHEGDFINWSRVVNIKH